MKLLKIVNKKDNGSMSADQRNFARVITLEG